jgi:hypothetical protein
MSNPRRISTTTTTKISTASPSSTQAPVSGSGICLGQTFCLYGEPDNQGNIIFTIHTSAVGWVGIGTGIAMSDSYVTVGWKNSTGGYVISDRRSVARVQPTLLPNQNSKSIPLHVPMPSWAKLGFSFLKPIQTTDFTFMNSTSVIYAYSATLPSTPDSISPSFTKHDTRGVLGVLDFVDNGTSIIIVPPPPVATGTQSSALSAATSSEFCWLNLHS